MKTMPTSNTVPENMSFKNQEENIFITNKSKGI
jgi:hypothetical protein